MSVFLIHQMAHVLVPLLFINSFEMSHPMHFSVLTFHFRIPRPVQLSRLLDRDGEQEKRRSRKMSSMWLFIVLCITHYTLPITYYTLHIIPSVLK
jgi:hypothetical protein